MNLLNFFLPAVLVKNPGAVNGEMLTDHFSSMGLISEVLSGWPS